MEAISRPTAKIACPPLSACYVLDASLGCATVGGNKNITQSPSLSAQLTDLPFPTRARTFYVGLVVNPSDPDLPCSLCLFSRDLLLSGCTSDTQGRGC